MLINVNVLRFINSINKLNNLGYATDKNEKDKSGWWLLILWPNCIPPMCTYLFLKILLCRWPYFTPFSHGKWTQRNLMMCYHYQLANSRFFFLSCVCGVLQTNSWIMGAWGKPRISCGFLGWPRPNGADYPTTYMYVGLPRPLHTWIV